MRSFLTDLATVLAWPFITAVEIIMEMVAGILAVLFYLVLPTAIVISILWLILMLIEKIFG